MWIYRITLELQGDDFSPRKFLENITDSLVIFNKIEPEDFIETNPAIKNGFGFLSVISPQKYGLQYETDEYEKWYLDFLEKNAALIRAHGIKEINLFVDFYHTQGQLNAEIFSRETLKKLVEFNIAIPFSYYNLTRDQISKMLEDTEYNKDKILDYLNTD